jgi:hypothetical protein
MSTNTMLPALPHPWTNAPGLNAPAIDSLRTTFPGTLTAEHEKLLRHSCGIDGTPLHYVDFTGQWHDEETLAVFRPCLTLAVDATVTP